MGGGASTGRSPEGKGKGKGVGADRKLVRAAESSATAKEVFEAVDADKNQKLTKAELSAAIQKHHRDLSVAWDDALVEDVVAICDADGDGMLDLDEFATLLAELKAGGGKLDANELRTRAMQKAEAASEAAARTAPSAQTQPRVALGPPDINKLFGVWELAEADGDWEDANKVRKKFDASWAVHVNKHLEWREKKGQPNSEWETILLKDDGSYIFEAGHGKKRKKKRTMKGLWVVDDPEGSGELQVGLTRGYDPENGYAMPQCWYLPKEFTSRFEAERNDAFHCALKND